MPARAGVAPELVTCGSVSIRKNTMHVHFALQPLLALLAGILILIRPRLLNYVVALYLIIVGVLGLFPNLHL